MGHWFWKIVYPKHRKGTNIREVCPFSTEGKQLWRDKRRVFSPPKLALGLLRTLMKFTFSDMERMNPLARLETWQLLIRPSESRLVTWTMLIWTSSSKYSYATCSRVLYSLFSIKLQPIHWWISFPRVTEWSSGKLQKYKKQDLSLGNRW